MQKIALFFLLIFYCCQAFCQQTKDSVAIVRLLEKESATWRSGDVQAHADCWVLRPYSKSVITLPDGRFIDVPQHLIIPTTKENMGKGGYAVNSNYSMSIHGRSAWVGHNEASHAVNGDITYSYEVRMLEKIKGKWKMVAQSLHIIKTEPK